MNEASSKSTLIKNLRGRLHMKSVNYVMGTSETMSKAECNEKCNTSFIKQQGGTGEIYNFGCTSTTGSAGSTSNGKATTPDIWLCEWTNLD